MIFMEIPKEILIEGPINPELVQALTALAGRSASQGGHSLFLGQVRDDIIDGKKVTAIDYSAYPSMVEESGSKIRETLFSKFPDVQRITILHSTGIVRAGEISLLVMVSAGHRREAIDACSLAVEMIKENLPVWKKEIFDDGTGRWKEN
jgi:molybdopterin synthase catalytic subunit